MTEQDDSSRRGGLVAAFALGALAGATLALLFAPRSGRETRELLVRKTRELKEKAGDALDDAKEIVRGKKAQIVAAVEAGREAMEEEAAKSDSV